MHFIMLCFYTRVTKKNAPLEKVNFVTSWICRSVLKFQDKYINRKLFIVFFFKLRKNIFLTTKQKGTFSIKSRIELNTWKRNRILTHVDGHLLEKEKNLTLNLFSGFFWQLVRQEIACAAAKVRSNFTNILRIFARKWNNI